MLSTLIVSIIFLSFFIFVYLNQERNKKIVKNEMPVSLILIIIASTIIKMIIAPYLEGYSVDMSTYVSWMDRAGQGLNGFYAEDYFCDYPPLFIIMFGALGFVKNLIFSQPSTEVSYFFVKMVGIIFDGLIAYEILKIYICYFKKNSYLLFAVFLVVLPAFFFNSVVWGQTDSVSAYFLILTFRMLLTDKLELTALFFTISALLKPQSFLFAPIIATLFIKSENVIFLKKYLKSDKWLKILFNLGLTFASSIVLMAIVIMPFRGGVPDLPFLIGKYAETFSSYNYASLNVFNLFNMFGGSFIDMYESFLFLNFAAWGWIFMSVAIISACIAVYITKDKTKIYLIIAAYLFAVVMLGVKMHERYWFAVVIFGFIYYIISGEKKLFFIFTGLSISYFCNLNYALSMLRNSKDVILEPVMVIFSIANLSILVYLIHYIYNSIGKESEQILNKSKICSDSGKSLQQSHEVLQTDFFSRSRRHGYKSGKKVWSYKAYSIKTDIIVVGIITVFYGVLAFYNLGSTKMPQTFVKLNRGDTIDFVFDDIKEINTVKYFIGHGLRSYDLSYSEDGISYTSVSISDKDDHQPYVFSWQMSELLDVKAKYFKLTTKESSTEKSAFFGDFIFYEKKNPLTDYHDLKGELIPVLYQAKITSQNNENADYLSDEYYTVPEIPSFENSFYFDEIYHGRTAYEYKSGLPVYETTHPPLGKLIISIGINIFGVNMFGFRFMGVLAGIMLIPVFFLLAKRLLKNSLAAYFTTFIYTFDFMHLSHSRISSIDIYVVLFVVAAYYFMLLFYENYLSDGLRVKTIAFLGLAGIFFGCAAAVKWTGIYSGFGLLVIYVFAVVKSFIQNKKEAFAYSKTNLLPLLGWSVLLFAALPALIYYYSYFNYFSGFLKEFNFENFYDSQLYIFNYHSKLTEGHPFSSPWYEWILNLRPIWMFSQSNLPENAEYTKTIATFGNMFLFWGGLCSLIYMLCKCVKEKFSGFSSFNPAMLFVFSGFFMQMLPWVLVTRATFIYHFFPMIPFISIAIGYYVNENIIKKGKTPALAITFAALVFVVFIMYYPVLTGNIVNNNYLSWLKILPRWSF